MAISSDRKKVYTTTDSSGKKIGISLWELMSCLEYYKRNTNGKRDLGMIVQNADFNKWSRRKPFRNSKASFASDAERDAARLVAYHGISIPAAGYGDMSVMANDVYNNAIDWEYERPRGASQNEPFRILDMDGYAHDANPPIFNVGNINLTINANSGDVGIAFGVVQQGDEYSLTLRELRPILQDSGTTFDDMYFGICCRREDGKVYYASTNKAYADLVGTLNEVGLSVRLDAPTATNSQYTYMAFPFFSTLPNAQSGGTYFPVPFAKTNVVVKRGVTAQVQSTIVAWTFANDLAPLYYRAYLTNTNSTDLTYTYRILALRSASAGNVYKQLATGTVTIPANGVAYAPAYIAGSDNDSLIVQNATHVVCELTPSNVGNVIVNVSRIIRGVDPDFPDEYPAPIA